MARDWRMVALAVVAAAALGAVCTLDAHAQAAKPAAKSAPKSAPKNAKAPDQQAEPEADDAEEAKGSKDAKAPAGKKKRQDPAEAQRAVEGAVKLVQAGKTDQAVQTLSAVLAGGNLPPAVMAKALYTRGTAYRQQSKPAQAISDLTSALWLKGGLGEAERADALKQRAAAYRDAGLGESGEPVASAGKAQEAPATSPSGGNWLSNLFKPKSGPPSGPAGQETASIQKNEPAPSQKGETASIQKADAPSARPPAATRVGSAWSSTTQVQDNREPPAAAARPPPPAPAPKKVAAAPPQALAQGRFRVQLATVRTQAEARALATKAKRELAAALAAREPEVDETVLGNMGAFYRVRVGPFATLQEAQALCTKAKGSGFDCLAVTQ